VSWVLLLRALNDQGAAIGNDKNAAQPPSLKYDSAAISTSHSQLVNIV
jgi:hypothetical protein